MNLVSIELHDTVAEIRLQNGVTNAINLDLVVQLSTALSQIAQNNQINGLVLTSSNEKFFSIGFDLPALYDLSEKDFKAFYQAFNRLCIDLYAFPKPTLAALLGHAIAGGCILAICCDYRIIASGHKLMGLNEIKLGVPVPYPADRILREIVGVRLAGEMMESGSFYPPDQALALGLVDQILPVEDVLSTAVEKLDAIGSLSPKAFELIKRNRVEQITERFAQVLAYKEDRFIECWYSPEARERLAEALTKF